jgi:hypothetical protein
MMTFGKSLLAMNQFQVRHHPVPQQQHRIDLPAPETIQWTTEL